MTDRILEKVSVPDLQLYGNTYAVHVTVALVGVATLNLALPPPPLCRCCYFQTPSVVHCVNATASAQSPKFLRNFYPQTIDHRLINKNTDRTREGLYLISRPTPVPCARDSVIRACKDSRARKPLQLRDKSTTLLRAWVVIVRHLDYILITRAGDGRWPRYQAKSLACPGCAIDDLHISHNASGMGANIRVLLIRNSSSHSSLDVNGLEFPCLAATMCFTRLRNPW